MKKVERKLKKDIKVESHLKVEDVKENLKFNKKERVGISINWKRVFTAVPVMAALALAVALQFGNFGGGEEFLAILPGASNDDLIQIAEKIKRIVSVK